MAYTKAGMKAADKYVKENYDKIIAKVPKGRKVAVEAYAKAHGHSVNSLVNDLLRGVVGMTEDEWKEKAEV